MDKNRLPNCLPTHNHAAVFWEELGRTVATFGFLEEVLGKAIFAFTGTRPYSEDEVLQAYEAWLPKLERALSDPLGSLIDVFEKSVKEHPKATISNLGDLTKDLRDASRIRNVLCHGSWGPPDASGASIPFFVNRQKKKFATPVDLAFLRQTQSATAELTCEVINTVTHMGWQFPGGAGPGRSIS
ncbi:MAG: hypothetical protein F6K48_35815 [Okeania sp. SIO3H1]|nr:hypothetical protein [Okeania sp. SIO3H1]